MSTPTSAITGTREAGIEAFLASLPERLNDVTGAMNSERQLPAAIAGEMQEAGLFKMLSPRELGGLELDPITTARVVESLARLDGSLGWLAMIASQSAWFPGFLEPETAREVLGAPDATMAGALQPGGKATPTADGYLVHGRWPFASGCTHATWVYGTCMVADPSADEDTTPDIRVVYVPAGEATIVDTWNTNGLRGTGSHDVIMDGVAVPAARTLPFPGLRPPWLDSPVYRDRLINLVFISQAAQALGMARAAFDAFTALAPGKTRWTSTVPLARDPAVRQQFAEAHASVESARSWLYDVSDDVWATITAGEAPSMEQRMALRLAITHAIRTATGAGRTLHDMAGSGTVRSDHPLARIVADLQAANAHVQATPGIFEVTGGFLLGDDTPVNPGLV